MGKFQRKYPDGAAEVIYRLKFEEGKTYAEAVHAASLGAYGVPPFEMSIGTAETYARKIKRQREGKELTRLAQGTPEEALEALRRRIVSLIDQELVRLEKDARQSGKLDLDRIGKATRVRAQLAGEIQPRPAVKDEAPKDGDKAMSAEAKRIMRAYRKHQRGTKELDSDPFGGAGEFSREKDQVRAEPELLAAA